MSEVKFTPGPWSIDADVIRGDDKPNGCVSVACVLDVAYPYGRRAGEQAQVNAHLIAAAPDLYRELEMARFTIAMEIATRGPRTLDREEKEALIAEHPTIKTIDAALKKARGES